MQDSNPERRNLTVLSAAIIIYYLAGGSIDPSHLKLGLIEMTFSNPKVLQYSLWLILMWFLYRHWVVNYDDYKTSRTMKLNNSDFSFILRITLGLSSKIRKQLTGCSNGFKISGVYVLDGKQLNLTHLHSSTIVLQISQTDNPFLSLLFRQLVRVKFICLYPHFLGYWTAPVLAVVAMALGLAHSSMFIDC